MLRGTFHLSVLPRKRGTFELRALDPAAHDSNQPWSSSAHSESSSSTSPSPKDKRQQQAQQRWWDAAPRVLSNRVIVPWCNGVLAKKAAMAEVIAGAQEVQAQGAEQQEQQ